MGFKNYSKFSGQNKKSNNETATVNIDTTYLKNEEVVQAVADEIIEEIITQSIVITGVVNCKKLNVRKEANKESDVLCIIDMNAEVTIDNDESTEDFYKVTISSGVEGFCMKKFITVK